MADVISRSIVITMNISNANLQYCTSTSGLYMPESPVSNLSPIYLSIFVHILIFPGDTSSKFERTS